MAGACSARSSANGATAPGSWRSPRTSRCQPPSSPSLPRPCALPVERRWAFGPAWSGWPSSSRLVIWAQLTGFLVAIAEAELLLAVNQLERGVGLYVVLLFLLPIHAALAPKRQA